MNVNVLKNLNLNSKNDWSYVLRQRRKTDTVSDLTLQLSQNGLGWDSC